ncbi:MAG: hypothetical protein AAF390_14110 [Pseudomonadota bacterium]
MKCFDLPVFGPTCLTDLTIKLGSTHVDLTHPGVAVTTLLLAVIGVFVFRSPA